MRALRVGTWARACAHTEPLPPTGRRTLEIP
ncbi:hypothetical protein STRAU_3287 [Streptomyces aurantiacus JA 4570]|uniref:Uncharacterized protein n=1 Tax=Streptomyces aurantiacus JA 4570 TaxID=1286094 RepID=S3ZKF1_9ACTN|nr:hypothetical protein STRAU_3287 [Streptomyces aurantiacus JA 4570]